MSLMHDALKEMDKRPDRALGTVSAIPAPAKSTVHDAGITAAEWQQSAKINADARADAYAEAEPAQSKVTLIAWLMAAVLFVLLGALWWVQSRQPQQVVSAVEGVAPLNPTPKSLAASLAPASIATPTPQAPPVSALSEPATALAVSPLPVAPPAPPAPSAPPTFANASGVPSVAGAPTQIAPVAISTLGSAAPSSVPSLPAQIPPTVKVPPTLAVAALPTAPIAPPAIVREATKSVAVSTKDAPRSRTAILSTTTLSQSDSTTPDIASNAVNKAPSKVLSNSIAVPDAVKENTLAANAAMPVPVQTTIAAVTETPKAPTLSAKQLAAQAAATAQEARRKEAEATQTALARTTASKNASARYATIGRALEAGDRAAAQNALNSLEQELPASSLTLLRARAWVAGSGADIAAARNAYAAILARLPEDENALLNMAALEAKDGKMDIARTLIAQALSANPESAAAKAAQQRIAALTAQVR